MLEITSELVERRRDLVAQRRELKAGLTRLAPDITTLDRVLKMLDPSYVSGQFVWPSADTTGRITLSSAQLAALLDGCEWRASWPELAG